MLSRDGTQIRRRRKSQKQKIDDRQSDRKSAAAVTGAALLDSAGNASRSLSEFQGHIAIKTLLSHPRRSIKKKAEGK